MYSSEAMYKKDETIISLNTVHFLLKLILMEPCTPLLDRLLAVRPS